MDICNPKEATDALPVFWVGIGYLMEREWGNRRSSAPSKLSLYGRNARAETVTSRLYSMRVWFRRRAGPFPRCGPADHTAALPHQIFTNPHTFIIIKNIGHALAGVPPPERYSARASLFLALDSEFLPAVLSISSAQRALGRPLPLVPLAPDRLSTRAVHVSSLYLATCPAHVHFLASEKHPSTVCQMKKRGPRRSVVLQVDGPFVVARGACVEIWFQQGRSARGPSPRNAAGPLRARGEMVHASTMHIKTPTDDISPERVVRKALCGRHRRAPCLYGRRPSTAYLYDLATSYQGGQADPKLSRAPDEKVLMPIRRPLVIIKLHRTRPGKTRGCRRRVTCPMGDSLRDRLAIGVTRYRHGSVLCYLPDAKAAGWTRGTMF
ncbi:hypothetical protein EVAR_29012_1 [Eumeta japonica]|uniref:Uncharacterized protein n=1 Tax=Eumeta variegata TaxID=151549 RepID=A0A4C1W512_EUMVA|nr:hypothetical protein EVAR_29012_1 [Eumeta japonica]